MTSATVEVVHPIERSSSVSVVAFFAGCVFRLFAAGRCWAVFAVLARACVVVVAAALLYVCACAVFVVAHDSSKCAHGVAPYLPVKM